MPELPEVETLVRTLRPALIGRTILSARLLWHRTLAVPSPTRFKKQVVNQQIIAVSRRAKFFILQLSSGYLIIHLRMSGDLRCVPGGEQPGVHDRLLLDLSDGSTFIFTDPRKFGRVWLVKDSSVLLSGLGPEPLSAEFTPSWLFSALHLRRRQLKPLLQDQCFIAGLGNIYTDEALHRAKLHPLLSSETVTETEASHLCFAIRDILEEGIRRNGASIDWVYRGGDFQNHFSVYGRAGQACPVCGTLVERILVGQRGTHYCPVCQKIR